VRCRWRIAHEDIAELQKRVVSDGRSRSVKVMRARGGEILSRFSRHAGTALAEATDGVAALRPEIEQRYQDRLTQRLIAATDRSSIARVTRGSRHLVERSDIAEELTACIPTSATSANSVSRGRSGQEAGFSLAGDEPRGQYSAFKDRQ